MTRYLLRLWSQKGEIQPEFCASTALAEIEPGDLGEPLANYSASQAMGISSKPPRRRREKREVSGMTVLIVARPAKRSALLHLPYRIYFNLDFAKIKVW